MGKLFIFMGKSAVGKDTLYDLVMERCPKYQGVVPYTTRPARDGEKEGKDYYFITEERFREMEQAGQVIESRCYQTVKGPWYYCTADDGQIDLEHGNYCLLSTLEGYQKIRDFFGPDNVIPVYIEVPDEMRLLRAVIREHTQEKPCMTEVCRRYLADEEDFSEEKLRDAGITHAIVNKDDKEDTFWEIMAVLSSGIKKQ